MRWLIAVALFVGGVARADGLVVLSDGSTARVDGPWLRLQNGTAGHIDGSIVWLPNGTVGRVEGGRVWVSSQQPAYQPYAQPYAQPQLFDQPLDPYPTLARATLPPLVPMDPPQLVAAPLPPPLVAPPKLVQAKPRGWQLLNPYP